MTLALRAAPLLAPGLGGVALAALSYLVVAAGVGAVAGVLFVPWQESQSTNGELPGNEGTTYDFNRDTGFLRILDRSDGLLAGGHSDRTGVFFDNDTGVPFARAVKGGLVFDGAAMAAVKASDDAKALPGAVSQSRTEDKEPKLCPDPGADQPGSEAASERAQKYQEQISRMINPQRPLKYGLAMNLGNPLTGGEVHYDECDEKTGTMIEAKGPGFNGLLSFPEGAKNVTENWLNQADRQVKAAGSRQIEWYFAEQYAAGYAQSLFQREKGGRERIIIKVQPADLK